MGVGKKNLVGDELSNGLLLAKLFGYTAWHFAAEMGNTQVVEKLWEWCKEILTTEELSSKFLLAKDELEQTVWHKAAINNELLLAKDLWGKNRLACCITVW